MKKKSLTEEEKFAGKQSNIYFSSAMAGIVFQISAILHLTNYNFLQGHLTDFSLSGQATSIIYQYLGKTKLGKFASAIIPPAIFTTYETLQPMIIHNSSTSISDIASYFGGSLAAYLGIEILGTKNKRRKIKDYVKNKVSFAISNDKSLEKIIS